MSARNFAELRQALVEASPGSPARIDAEVARLSEELAPAPAQERPAGAERGPGRKLEGVRLLWACGFYDGPSDGVAMFEGGICWFATTDPSWRRGWRYRAYEMDDAQVRAALTDHLGFEAYVGTHTCAHANAGATRPFGEIRPVSEHHRFYDAPRARGGAVEGVERPEHTGEVLGWFHHFTG